MVSEAKFKRACDKAVKAVKKVAPRKSGHLADNGVRIEYPSPNICRIYVDTTTMAPYMPYTNEPWISPKWNGKKNPNEGWWQGTLPMVCNIIAQELKGVIKNGK